MNQQDAAHAWWSRLRHQGLLLSPVVMLERFPSAPDKAPFHVTVKLRNAYNRFASTATTRQDALELEQPAILGWVDTLLEQYLGYNTRRIARQHSIPEMLTAVVRSGSRSDTIRPHRVIFADEDGQLPGLLVMADTSPQVGRGRGRTAYAHFLELLRGTGQRLGLLTNGHQFRLVYAGLDFESWCEWESDRWFDDGEGTEELRHGWTWDDCWKDTVALLGSEDAVREYIEGKHEPPIEEPQKNGPTDLFGEPLPPKQGKLS